MAELRVTVLAARDLKRDGGSRPMSVYSLLWIDPASKLATRVHVEGGPHPVWNEVMAFTLGEDVLLHPHPAITIKVVSEAWVEDRWRNTLLGTAYLSLAEIARIKVVEENPEDPDVVQLQLATPSGRVQGSISLSISLIGSSQRWPGLSSMEPLMSNRSVQPVIGYPVSLLQPTPYEVHQQASSSDMEGANLQAYSSRVWDCPFGLSQSGGAVPYYSLLSQEESSAYIQTPQPFYRSCMDETTERQRNRNFTLAVIGGAIAGFVIGDILGVFFR